MRKAVEEVKKKSFKKWIILGGLLLLVLLIILPAFFTGYTSSIGNIAIIPLEGVITSNGESYLGQSTISSTTIIDFIQQAEEDTLIKVIVLEINSPGGTPVASDEIASAVKKAEKPVIAVIRETGASGAYWIASASDYIIANRMSITGSIGVISSYLEFSGLMEKYGVRYERLVAGDLKDLGVPYKKLSSKEEEKMQKMLDKLHGFFIEEVAENRHLQKEQVKKLATGEVFLGVEALELDLIDELGDLETAKEYILKTYQLSEFEPVYYVQESGLFEALAGLSSSFSFHIGEGLGSVFVTANKIMMT